MPAPFVLFGHSHLAVLTVTLVLPLALAVIARLSRAPAIDRTVRIGFALWLIGIWTIWYWLIFARGWQSAQTMLPMHLCDWACIAVIVTMLAPNQRSYELAYFWALVGTLQGLLTPDLAVGLPDLRAIVFFGFHGGVIAGVLYLTFGSRLRPYVSSVPRAIAATLIYAATAGLVDWIFRVNFGYLSAKPAQASVLDFLAPWPWYIGELVGIGLIAIFVLYTPWFIADRLRRKS
jgi:hypothetical integral membrane protein (TIGR02206 family)